MARGTENYLTLRKHFGGYFKKAGVTPKRHLAEFKNFETELNLGDTITVELFDGVDYVDVDLESCLVQG